MSGRVLDDMPDRLCPRGLGNPCHHSTQFLGHLWVVDQQILQPRCPDRLLLQAHPLIVSPSSLHYSPGAFQPLFNGSGPGLVASSK
ncbi:hypothetical protein AB0J89_00730 [Micromonospora chokoriensis]